MRFVIPAAPHGTRGNLPRGEMREAFDLLIGIRGDNDGIQNKSHCLGRAEEEDINIG